MDYLLSDAMNFPALLDADKTMLVVSKRPLSILPDTDVRASQAGYLIPACTPHR